MSKHGDMQVMINGAYACRIKAKNAPTVEEKELWLKEAEQYDICAAQLAAEIRIEAKYD